MKTLLLVTTVPSTMRYILAGQPRYLAQHYHVVIGSSSGEDLLAVERSEQVPCFAIEMSRGITPLQDLKSIWQMYRLMRRINPDVVHSYTPKAGLVCAVAGWLARVPVRIHTFTGLIFPTSRGLKKRILKLLDYLVCQLNSHIIAEGVGVQQQLQTIAPNQKIQIIGNGNIAGLDINYFQPNPPLPPRTDFRTFCFIGRLNKDKGVEELISAFIKLPPESNCILLLAGEFEDKDPVSPATKQVILTHARIRYLGFIDDVRPPLAQCDVFVLPSYREGFPNAVLQACAMEKPCIVTDIPGSNEIICSEQYGWVVPSRCEDALYQAMKRVLQLPTEQLILKGKAARQNVIEKYERNQYLQSLLDFYKSVF